MASSTSHLSDRSKIEQVVVEFFAKCLHIILESRIPALYADNDSLGSSPLSSSSGTKTRDRWFNLALGDCTAALQNFEPWRRNFSDPMIVDILLDQSSSSIPRDSPSDQHWHKDTTEGHSSIPNDCIILERWTVQFEQYRRGSLLSSSLGNKGGGNKTAFGPNSRGGSKTASEEMKADVKEAWSQRAVLEAAESPTRRGMEVPAVYKRTVVMLRTLYSTCRLLPAYRLFRLSSTPSNCCNFSLNYRVLSPPVSSSELDKRDTSLYAFTPVDTLYGRMRLSVMYRRTTSVIALEVVPSILPRIIPDYVGSPTTDPLKKFTGDPQSLPSRGASINRGVHMISVPSSLQNSPPGMFLDRRHSWSGRVNQIQPALQPPSSPSYRISRSPSPSYPFQPASPYTSSPFSPYSQKQPSDCSMSPLCSPISSGDRLSGVSTAAGKYTSPISIDNKCSPPLSPSSSPSPPTIYSGSDPVSIPSASPYTRGTKFPSGDIQHRYRNMLPPLSPSSRKAGLLLRSSSESPRYSVLPSQQHAQHSRSFESTVQLHMLHDDTGQQVFSNTTLSRSSSRTHIVDDGEDEDFSCPFAVDDMDSEEKSSKSDVTSEVPESSSIQQGSQDAAVGAFIRILKSAGLLRHPHHMDASLGFECNRDPMAMTPRLQSAPVDPFINTQTTKTAAAALEEFIRYKNTRDHMCAKRAEAGASVSMSQR